jgi:hypothetical protein
MKIEKKCHACMGVWWQVVEFGGKWGKEIIFKSKRKKDCVNFVAQRNVNEELGIVTLNLDGLNGVLIYNTKIN